MTTRSRLGRSSAWIATTAIVLAVSLAIGCRDKSNPPVGPDGPDPGDGWRLQLIHPAILYRDSISHHVPNDTINVRLYNPQGQLAAGIIIYCRADGSPTAITAAVTSRSDTAARPWGCDPALMYWGVGVPGEPEAPEVIRCSAVQNGDTVARATSSFYVYDQPPG